MTGQARKALVFGGLGSFLPLGWGSQRMGVGEESIFSALILPRSLCA